MYKLTCGLEIHCQLSTSTKLFSLARNTFAAKPNSQVAFFDAALPGTQPNLNLGAVLLAVKAALALNCSVHARSSFDRKHYFYPDQPNGYQITQHYHPLASGGHVQLLKRDGVEESKIGIIQVQLEQDTGKSIYAKHGVGRTLVDLNRTGSPLIEIVTTPSIHSTLAAGVALSKIQGILRAVGASEANMESGQLRCDVNVSVANSSGTGQRCEIKNLASVRNVMDAVSAEFIRQSMVMEEGGEVLNETRGFDAVNCKTFRLRGKEGEVDYRYMPEPDLPPILLDETFIAKCKAALGELPDATFDRITSPPYSLQVNDARALMTDRVKLAFYEQVTTLLQGNEKAQRMASSWIMHELFGRLGIMELAFGKSTVDAARMANLISSVQQGDITRSAGKSVLMAMLDGDADSVLSIIKKLNLGAVSATEIDLKAICEASMARNPKQAAQLKAGKAALVQWFVGQIMRETRGRVKAEHVENIIRDVAKI